MGVCRAGAGLERETTARLIATLVGGEGAEGLLSVGSLALLSRGDPGLWAGTVRASGAGLERLAAAFELGRRVEAECFVWAQPLSSPREVYEFLAPTMRGRMRETFVVILLDGRHRPIGVERVSEGTLTSSLVHPREVFAPALEGRAAAIVLAHNHPSGDAEPSLEDHEVTRRLVRAGKLLGVPVLDHVVLGLGAWTSLREASGGIFGGQGWQNGEAG